jgi:signal recognition particle subunit SRP54
MFESLSDRLGSVVSKLRSRGRLSEADVEEILGEIRTALLEADVNVGVAVACWRASATRPWARRSPG